MCICFATFWESSRSRRCLQKKVISSSLEYKPSLQTPYIDHQHNLKGPTIHTTRVDIYTTNAGYTCSQIWSFFYIVEQKSYLDWSLVKSNQKEVVLWDSPLNDVKSSPAALKKSRPKFSNVTPPILVPKWGYWWRLSNCVSFYQIWYPYDGVIRI